MKSLKLKNGSIVKIFNLLSELPTKGQATRGAVKLKNRLQEKEAEYVEAKTEMQKQYTELDEFGEMVVLSDGVSSPIRKDLTKEEKTRFSELTKEIDNDLFEISFVEYSDKYEKLFTVLENLDMELTGANAEAYDELMDAYEANESKKEEEK